MKGKLELTWAGKDEPLLVEPRILLYDEKNSYGAQDTGNMLIHGDNLLALKALEQKSAGQVKCVYIDKRTAYLIQANGKEKSSKALVERDIEDLLNMMIAA